ncbi:PucR family transcriptional regulator [Cohnella silvisoli]|uniref:PucR family transcriptional regulator ligand-binding domain-containing protein n=1 Tax=Cohnella silvisoli TaxID=2873699 RepID=A0ABV1KZE7_9BACL|nr:PucR family transcriptional regulator [Cohnella silvisoli]MCD9024725.1 PucR family transcriptional regulator ligand-binding domain-containing protein [Cohnella silvisoli]
MMLKDLMNVPVLASARVIAGANGLTREVQSVNIMDAPDIIQYLKPGELLLTTAYIVKDDPHALRMLISNMSQVGCAGIAIKTKRFLSEVPHPAIQIADELHFPIIELPLNHTLGEVLYDSVSFLLEKRTDELKYSLESHQNFANLVLQGQGIPEIINSLSQLLGAPVLLLDPSLNSIATSAHFNVVPYSEAVGPLKELMSAYSPNEPTRNLRLLEPDHLPFRQLVIHPIQTVQFQGYLIAFSDEDKKNPLPKLAVEQAVNVIRFELLKKQAVKERSRRYKSEFLSDLVEGFFTSELEVLHRGKKYGLTDRCLSFCIAVKRDPIPAKNRGPQEDKGVAESDVFYEVIKREIKSAGLSFAIFNKNDALILVVSLPKSESKGHEMPANLEERLKEAILRIERVSGIAVSLGVGKPVVKLLDCPVTYKEAVEALQYGYRSKRSRFVQFYSGKELIDLFRLVPEEELLNFYENTFVGLEGLEKKEKHELLKTLLVYLDNHGQIADTAKQLYIHRNTVVYRLNKLQQLTGREFDVPGDSLRFRIAFLIEPLLKITSMSP